MNKMPAVTVRDIYRLLNHFGDYSLKRGHGSGQRHLKFVKLAGKGVPIVIPNHPGQVIKPGTLRQIIEAIAMNEGLTEAEILRILAG